MNKKHILLVSARERLNESLTEWAQQADQYNLSFAHTDEKAIELCHQQQFDLILVDASQKAVDGKKLLAVLPILQDDLLLLNYGGEDAGELTEKIHYIFERRKLERLQRMLVFDEGQPSLWDTLPPFSAN